jgi:hypothetical protein
MSPDPAAKTRAGNEAHTMTNAMRPARMRFISTGISIWDLDAASHQHQAVRKHKIRTRTGVQNASHGAATGQFCTMMMDFSR